MISAQISGLFPQLKKEELVQRLRDPIVRSGFIRRIDFDRDRPDRAQYELDRDYPDRYDEPEVQRDPEYPFQDFNYGP
jgi:hypothetical protein